MRARRRRSSREASLSSRVEVRGVASEGDAVLGEGTWDFRTLRGLLALDAALAPGTDFRATLDLDDPLLTLKLTPNRADCLCLLGVAARGARRSPVPS